MIQDTADGVSLEKTAAEINRHPTTVFRMRHKFLSFLEEENGENVITKPCEADEKYVSKSCKVIYVKNPKKAERYLSSEGMSWNSRKTRWQFVY